MQPNCRPTCALVYVTYYYLFDGLGSVVGMVDGSGTLQARYGYDPYGQTVVKTGGAVAEGNPFRYTGAYLDSTGLYKMGERYYDPARGRFTQLDPLGTGYGYAGDDPINFTDPTGLLQNDGDGPATGLADGGGGTCGCESGGFRLFDDDDHAGGGGPAWTEPPYPYPPGVGRPATGDEMPGHPHPIDIGRVDWPKFVDGLEDIIENPPGPPANWPGFFGGCLKCIGGVWPGFFGG